MKQDLEEKLFKKYAFFHPERPIQVSLMAFGFECGSGWYNIIDSLCAIIDWELKNNEDIKKSQKEHPFEVVQVKEKFGGLRFYTNWETPIIAGAIYMAERLSYKTCEMCGNPGEANSDGWITTLCESCRNKK